MLAAAYWANSGLWPAVKAKYRSTAYSGRTAMRARRAMARLPEMSTWAASAAQANRNAEATTPAPNTRAAASGRRSVPASRRTTQGPATTATSASFALARFDTRPPRFFDRAPGA